MLETVQKQAARATRASPGLLIPQPRRTLTVIFGLYLTSIALPAIMNPQDWLGWLPATMATHLSGVIFGSLAIASTTAWLSGAVKRSGLSDWVSASARGNKGAFLPPILVGGILGSVAYLIVFGALLVVTLNRSDGQLVDYLHLVLVLPITFASAFAWAAIGTVLGRFVRTEVAIPLAFILAYVFYVVPVLYLSETPLLNATLSDGRIWLALQPTTGQLTAKLVLWAGLALLFSAIATSQRRTVQAGAWVTVTGFSLVVVFGSTPVSIAGATERVCLGTDPQVCTDGAHQSVLPEFEQVVSDAVAVLPAALRPSIVDETVTPISGALPVAPTKANSSPSLIVGREETIARLGEALFYSCPTTNPTNRVTAASLDAWWRIENNVTLMEPITPSGAPWLSVPDLSEAPANARRLADLPPEAKGSWFDQNAPKIRGCDLQDITWP